MKKILFVALLFASLIGAAQSGQFTDLTVTKNLVIPKAASLPAPAIYKPGALFYVYSGADSGLYIRRNNATSWMKLSSNSFTFTGSIVNSGGTVQLVNDQTNPGAGLVYGTNGSGVKGWYSAINGGTVTSVGVSMPAGFSVSGSPVTSAGTITVTTTLNGMIRGNGSGFTTGTLQLTDVADATLTYAKLQNATARSILGRSTGTNGVLADIVAGSDGHILRRQGGVLAFGSIGDNSITDLSWAKITGTPTFVTGGANLGTGVGVYSNLSSNNLRFRSIRAGSGATVALSGDDIVISATGGGGGSYRLITNTTEMATAIASGGEWQVAEGVYTYAANTTFPANLTLKMDKNAVIKANSGVVLDIYSRLVADDFSRIFDTTGRINLYAGSMPYVTPQHFGAVADGNTTDDTRYIVKAIEFAGRVSAIKFPANNSENYYKVSKTINFWWPIGDGRVAGWHIFGDKMTDNNTTQEAGSVIVYTGTFGSCFNLRGTRLSYIHDLVFIGGNVRPNTAKGLRNNVGVWNLSYWSTTGYDTTKYNHHAAIGVDNVLSGYDIVVPKTSNTLPYDISSASSGNADAWYAFDDQQNTEWSATFSNPTQLTYEFDGYGQSMKSYRIVGAETPGNSPNSWTFQGWDGGSWITLDTRSSITWTSYELKTFTLGATSSRYRKYRLNITAINGGSNVAVTEFDLIPNEDGGPWSAQGVIRDVKIENFVVGISISGNDGMQNDTWTIDKAKVWYCGYAFSIGNDQNRAVNFIECNVESVYGAFVNNRFGKGNGSAFSVTGGQFTTCFKLFEVSIAQRGQMAVTGLFAEACGMIGGIASLGSNQNNHAASFSGCEFGLDNNGINTVGDNEQFLVPMVTFSNAANVVFNGCTFHSDRPEIIFDNSGYTEFVACSFEDNKKTLFLNDPYNVRVSGITTYQSGGTQTWVRHANHVVFGPSVKYYVRPEASTAQFYLNSYSGNQTSPRVKLVNLECYIPGQCDGGWYGALPNTSNMEFTVTVSSTESDFYQVGDYLFSTVEGNLVSGVATSFGGGEVPALKVVSKTSTSLTLRRLAPDVRVSSSISTGNVYSAPWTWMSKEAITATGSGTTVTVTNGDRLNIGDFVRDAGGDLRRVLNVSGTTITFNASVASGVLKSVYPVGGY